jgi:SpoIID/LytB domain protein
MAKRFGKGITDANIEAFLAAPAKLFYGGATRFAPNRFRWKKTLTTEQVSELVNKHYKVGTVNALIPMNRGISGRMKSLRIIGETASATAAGDLHIRRLLGGLRSTLFVVDKKADGFHFRGGGFGHGAGMCQIGAIGMAEQNRAYADILRHYYNAPSLRRLY